MTSREEWAAFVRKGRYSITNQVASVRRSSNPNGEVRGYYSDFLLDPSLSPTDARYPSHDHRDKAYDDADMVVDMRVINDMKTIFSEQEFWSVVEHLYAVGVEKGTIDKTSEPRKLSDNWGPARDFD